MSTSQQFYSYLWLRVDGSPYYAGKGTGNRAFIRFGHRVHPPVNRNRILVFPMLSEAEAFESEIALIDLFGRKDLGIGCLRNFTNGGDGVSGLRHTEDAKRRMSIGHKGLSIWNKGIPSTEEHRLNLSAAQKGKHSGARPAHVLAALHSPEAIAKSAASRKGRKLSEDTKRKISQAHIGMKPTDETLQKLRESHMGQIAWNKGKKGGTWSPARRAAQGKKNGE